MCIRDSSGPVCRLLLLDQVPFQAPLRSSADAVEYQAAEVMKKTTITSKRIIFIAEAPSGSSTCFVYRRHGSDLVP